MMDSDAVSSSSNGMKEPLVIVFDGSVDELIIKLLKQHKANEDASRPKSIGKMLRSKRSWEVRLGKLASERRTNTKLIEEFDRLRPEHIRILKAEDSCKILDEQIQDVTAKNNKLEAEITKMKKGICQKTNYMKLSNARRALQEGLVKKNNALKKEELTLTKTYEKLNQKAYGHTLRQKKADEIIEANKSLLNNIRNMGEMVGNVQALNTVSQHITELKEKQARLINELQSINSNKQCKVNLDTDLNLLKMESKAYIKCNKALEKEKKALTDKHAKLLSQELKILKERGYLTMQKNKNGKLQQLLQKMSSSLHKEGILQLSLTSALNRLEEKEILERITKSDMGTQTGVDVPEQISGETVSKGTGGEEFEFGGIEDNDTAAAENAAGTSVIGTVVDNEQLTEMCEIETPRVEEDKDGKKSSDDSLSLSAESDEEWEFYRVEREYLI